MNKNILVHISQDFLIDDIDDIRLDGLLKQFKLIRKRGGWNINVYNISQEELDEVMYQLSQAQQSNTRGVQKDESSQIER